MNKTTHGKARHPAKYSQALMPALASSLVGCKTVLDPFAGTGRIHELNGYVVELSDGALHNLPHRVPPHVLELDTYGIELEPEWAEQHPRTVQGNALSLPFTDSSFDAICTSPTYGNRMADHHDAQDTSTRNTYTHTLGRKLHPDNSGQLHWGEAYREFHLKAWSEAVRVLRPGGRFVLNFKDHIKNGEVVTSATEWHKQTLQALGLVVVAEKKVETPGNRQGANGQARVDHEWVIVFFKPSDQLSETLNHALEQRNSEQSQAPVVTRVFPFRSDRTFNEFLIPDQRSNQRNRK